MPRKKSVPELLLARALRARRESGKAAEATARRLEALGRAGEAAVWRRLARERYAGEGLLFKARLLEAA